MSREDVIRRLVDREQRHLPLTEETALIDNPELHELACEHFGTWETALEYAGVDLAANLPPRQWDPEKVVEALQERQRQGLPMRGLVKADQGLSCACCRYFGSIKKALKAAGISTVPLEKGASNCCRWDSPLNLASISSCWRSMHPQQVEKI